MIDYHTHTVRCKHAEGSMEEYVESACAQGFSEMAFTDHIPMEHPMLSPFSMSADELEGYVDEVLALKERYKERIGIKLGIEADFTEGTEEYIQSVIDSYPFDLVLGSVHTMDGWGVDNPDYSYKYEEGDVAEIFRTYFTHLEKAVRTGMYDIMSHPDLVKKLGFLPDEDYSGMYTGVLDAMQEMGVSMEINSGGWQKPAEEQYPSFGFLKAANKRSIPVSTGSDAHAPDEVGRDFDRLYGLLEEAGYNAVVSYTGRVRSEVNILVQHH